MIIYADMVGDLFHAGHVNLLKKLSSMGYLIVGLNSDKDVKSYKRTPIIPLEDRTTVVKSCRYVDKVISPCPLTITKEFMEQHKIDLVIHAHDENDTSYDYMYSIPIEMGKFMRIERTKGISTTQIIQKIQKLV